jgi:hypothetical protein
MIVEHFRYDAAGLIAALTDPQALARYRASLADELPGLADPPMAAQVRRLDALAAQAQDLGFARFARRDPEGADGLLSDLLAQATWQGQELPLMPDGAGNRPNAETPRGLLGQDREPEGAGVWVVAPGVLALARWRRAGSPARRDGTDSPSPVPGG